MIARLQNVTHLRRCGAEDGDAPELRDDGERHEARAIHAAPEEDIVLQVVRAEIVLSVVAIVKI